MMEPVEAYLVPSADVHGLRELMQQIIALQDEITPEDFLQLKDILRKMDRLLSPCV
jgi:hypothetical protein